MGTAADHPTQAATGGAAPLLGPELTIPHAAVLREQLLRALADAPGPVGDDAGTEASTEAGNARMAGSLVLDLSGVSDCDSSGMQLLLATRASLALRGRTLRLHAPSPAVREALATFGLGSLLGAPGSTVGDTADAPAAVAHH